MHPLPPAVLMVAISLAAQDRAVAKGGKARVSPCKPLCARLGAGVACVPAAVPRNERCGVCAGGVEGRAANVLETLV